MVVRITVIIMTVIVIIIIIVIAIYNLQDSYTNLISVARSVLCGK